MFTKRVGLFCSLGAPGGNPPREAAGRSGGGGPRTRRGRGEGARETGQEEKILFFLSLPPPFFFYKTHRKVIKKKIKSPHPSRRPLGGVRGCVCARRAARGRRPGRPSSGRGRGARGAGGCGRRAGGPEVYGCPAAAAAAARAGGGGGGGGREREEERRAPCAPSSSPTCEVLDCAVAPVVHIIMENGSRAPKAIRMAPEGAPSPQGLALYVITEEIIVSPPALAHRHGAMIKRRARGERRAPPRPGLDARPRARIRSLGPPARRPPPAPRAPPAAAAPAPRPARRRRLHTPGRHPPPEVPGLPGGPGSSARPPARSAPEPKAARGAAESGKVPLLAGGMRRRRPGCGAGGRGPGRRGSVGPHRPSGGPSRRPARALGKSLLGPQPSCQASLIWKLW